MTPATSTTPPTLHRVNDHGGAHVHGAVNVDDQVNVVVNVNETSLQPVIISVAKYSPAQVVSNQLAAA